MNSKDDIVAIVDSLIEGFEVQMRLIEEVRDIVKDIDTLQFDNRIVRVLFPVVGVAVLLSLVASSMALHSVRQRS